MLLPIPLLPILIPQMFGPSYNPMILGAQAMMVSVALSTVFFWLSAFSYASGKIDVWTKVHGLYAGCVIGLGWFCIQWWGFSGLAMLIGVSKVCLTVFLAVIFLTTGKRV
jgi:O-antigen/teichoic acid export membrane protein